MWVMSDSVQSVADPASVLAEASRRRTFAVISHPDAGKSTITEAMALHAHLVEEAGVTHGKASRAASLSDWGEMEQSRGISISSTALRFGYEDAVFNLLDTPGHADFSEDTYRVLTAVDFAVMLLDAAKGMETQTRKLFEACRALGLPVVTVVNKWDRPGDGPLGLFDSIQEATGMVPVAVNWPVGEAEDFQGLLTPGEPTYLRHEVVDSGAHRVHEQQVAGAEDTRLDPKIWQTAVEGATIAAELNGPFDQQDFLAGRSTPVLFTAAAGNVGVLSLLEFLLHLAPAPADRADVHGRFRAVDSEFSGYVFKVQGGMNPAHRDQVAFVRVNSGVFTRGMNLRHAQSGRPMLSKYAHHLVGRGRQTATASYPGDVVGFVNAAGLKVGDTVYAGPAVTFPGMPRFNPELFRVVRNLEATRYKGFAKGLTQLEDEGAIQVLRDADGSPGGPVLAAVGDLQFDVAIDRLRREYGVKATLDAPMPFDRARALPVHGVEELARVSGLRILYRPDGQALALFPDRWKLNRILDEFPHLFGGEHPTR